MFHGTAKSCPKVAPGSIPQPCQVPGPWHHQILPHSTARCCPKASLTIESQVGEPLEGRDAQPQALAQLAGTLHLGAVQPAGSNEVTSRTLPSPSAPARPLQTVPFTPHPACCSSMAKARTVRTLPSTSSATPVALATCGGGHRQEAHVRPPDPVPVGSRIPWEVSGLAEGQGTSYLLLCLSREAAEGSPNECPSAHQHGQCHEQQRCELG